MSLARPRRDSGNNLSVARCVPRPIAEPNDETPPRDHPTSAPGSVFGVRSTGRCRETTSRALLRERAQKQASRPVSFP